MRTRRALLLGLIGLGSLAATPRHASVIRQFRKQTGCTQIVDHRIPICAGGPDTLDNLQCQDRATSLLKDRFEVALCRELTRQGYTLVKR